MANPQEPPQSIPITVDKAINELAVRRWDYNLDQEVFTTTTDKARLVLIDVMQKLELRDAWKAPLSILVTLAVVLPTINSNTLQDVLNIPKDTWRAIFILGWALSLIWLIQSLVRREKAPTINDIIERLRKQAPEAAKVDLLTGKQKAKETETVIVERGASQPRQGEPYSVVLGVAKVPFKGGQNADFVREDLPQGSKGFELKITVPKEIYWRAGFVLAPEDYILDGRSDVSIDQYFLFHIGMGNVAKPKEPAPLFYQAYRQAVSDVWKPLQSESPVVFNITFRADRRHLTVSHVNKERYETDLDPSYFRYLYILAWADQFGPFRVPVELRLH